MSGDSESRAPGSIVDVLRQHAAAHPERPYLTWLADGERVDAELSFGEMAARVDAVAAALAAQGIAPGDRALLLYPQGPDFLTAFLGCLSAGIVAVPAYPPRNARHMPRIERILADAGASVILSLEDSRPRIEGWLADRTAAAVRFLATDLRDPAASEEPARWTPPDLRDRVAFLQYTSGSTGQPKGVVVTHANILVNMRMISEAFGHDETSHVVSWLPAYHDMGLVGNLLQPLFVGSRIILMSPAAFLQKPLRWLQAVSTFRARTTGAPNFAFDLTTRAVTAEQKRELDLSALDVMYSGSEPIAAGTLERFAQAFAPCGFRASALYPCYGMAETTLIATGSRRGQGARTIIVDGDALAGGRVRVAAAADKNVRTLVGCGWPVRGEELVIADPDTRRSLPDQALGEIWIRGPHVAREYWGNRQLSEETFGARLADDTGPFLRTGDLGFVRDGELFVAGRLKDLVIIRGRKHHPHDIERAVSDSHPALAPGSAAAFGVEVNGEERLAVVQEVQRTALRDLDVNAVRQAMAAAVADEFDLRLSEVVLIRPLNLPKTSSGKVQRQACRDLWLRGELEVVASWSADIAAPPADSPAVSVAPERTADAIAAWMCQAIAAETGGRAEAIDRRDTFASHGLDSVTVVRMSGALSEWLRRDLSPTLMYDFPTVEALANHLAEGERAVDWRPAASESREPIAIIGIGCRFPGAECAAGYWQLLADGVDAISEVPADRWSLDEFYDADPETPGRMSTRWGGFLPEVDRFDAGFFAISPREAAFIDPQQRLLMEVAWEALEDAGLPAEQLRGQPVGVFIGMSSYDYGGLQLTGVEDIRDGYVNTGSALSIGANRLSYVFDFRGPSMVVDTACSSSLVATHYACQSLRLGESRVALAGGINLILSPAITVGFSKLHAMAPDGRCKAFDARADGYVRAEGVGIVVLKPLHQALSDGDRVYAVIRGGAINQDGHTNGLTAPSGPAQEALVRQALSSAGVAPADIQYVEAHGTGTSLGDPIEMNALGAVLAEGRPRESRCAVGSVKTNVGHLEAAAGIAGLIKLALSLERRQLPPSLHFEKPNPYIRFDVLPLRVPTRLEAWPVEASRPARGGVSSFGFGGTNAHLVLEEPPVRAVRAAARAERPCLLPISAKSEAALHALAARYVEQLADVAREAALEDVCATASVRRSHHQFRLAAVANNRSEMAAAIAAFLAGERPRDVETGRTGIGRRKIAFVFPGQGSQWLGMGRELGRSEPVFADVLARCAAAFSPHVDWSLAEVLNASAEESRLEEVDVVQPAIFAIQVALGELWRSWGVVPDAVAGHSMGEVAAAVLAGAICLDDAARIICRRSRLARTTSGRGAMAVVDLSLARSFELLNGYEDRLAVAVSNSPTSTVLSGDTAALEEVLGRLERDGVFCRRIKVDYASHSPQMDPLRGELLAVLDGLAPRTPTVPLYSTVTGAAIAGPALGPDYWVRNLREPVLFAGVVEKLLDDGINAFLEVSPHPILLPAIQQCLVHFGREALVLASLRRDEHERRALLSTLANLYAHGQSVEWGRVHAASARTALPTYAWQRERFWSVDRDAGRAPGRRTKVNVRHPLIGERLVLAAGPPTHIWQGELTCAAFPYLKDHQVDGAIVVPATGFLEMALEAAGEVLGEETSFALEDVQFERPVILSETGTRQVQVVVARQLPTRFEWEVFVDAPSQAGEPAFSRCARGRIRVRQEDENETGLTPIASIRARCGTERSAAEHYQLMETVQLEYGPAFQGVESLWIGRGESLGRLKPPPRDANRYQVHPAFFDAAWQVLAGARSRVGNRTVVPVSVDVVRFGARPLLPAPMWVHAVWNGDGSDSSGSVALLTETGELAGEARGIRLAALDARSAERDAFYTVAWEKQPSPPTSPLEAAERTVAVLADSSGAGARLMERIAARGGRVLLVVPETCPDVAADCASSTYRIDAARAEDYDEFLADLKGREIRLDAVVHMWSLDVAEEPGQAHTGGWESVLLLAQALARGGSNPGGRLCVVTRNAQCVVPGEPVSPFQAPAWGLTRTIAQEHPELSCTAIDLSAPASDDEMQALADAVWQRGRESEIALRGRDRFVSRLNPTGDVPANEDLASRSPVGGPGPFRAQIGERGNLSSVSFRGAARRHPGPGEVEIENVAAGLNFRDVLFSLGLLPDDSTLVLGDECAGRISAIGDGVANWAVGDEVIALARPSLSSFVTTKASLVVAKPSGLDFEEAATIPVACLTAYYSLCYLGRLQPGERVLIHSATGGVGLACVRLAQHAGAEIFATAGTEEKRRFLERLGVRRVMDSHSLAFADEIREATNGEGIDVVVNALAGEALARGLAILRPGGRFIELGKRDRFEGGQLPLRSLEDSRSFFLVDLNSLASKRPDFCGRLLGAAAQLFEDQHLIPLPKEVFPASDLGGALHHMARGRHIGKVVVRLDQGNVPVAPPTEVSALIRDDSTYVLTGGLGGIALVTSRWLVEQGARTLVLAGRSAPSPEAQQAIEAITSLGARVVVERFDVADAGCVSAAFARWARDLPPVRGIVHAAGMLDDGILLQQTRDRFRRVMAPKVEGAWNLHRASLGLPLDFFVLFSSAASVLGSAGQSNYAAANQFLDALAHYRRARNLPATSINWGPWSDVGLAARPERGGRLDASGIESLSPKQGMNALERVLLDDPAQVTVMQMDWQKWRAAYPLLADAPFLSAFSGTADAVDAPVPYRAQLLSAPPAERAILLLARLRLHAAGVLRLNESRLDVDQPLSTLGIDSLMAVELKSRVERELGVAIPLLQLVKGPSLSELAEILIASMTGSAAPVTDKSSDRQPAQAAPNLLLSVLSLKEEGRS